MPSRKRHRQPKPHDSAAITVLDTTQHLWEIDTPDAIPRLVDEVFAEARYRPLIIVSKANDTQRTRIDIRALLHEVGEHANVAVLTTGTTTWAFTHSVPDHFRAYGGGVRLCWPYASRSDDPDRHPIFITRSEQDSPRTINRIVSCLQERGFLPEPETPEYRPPWAEDEPTGDSDQDKVDKLLSELSAAHDRIAVINAENNDLRRTVHSLTDQVETLHRRLHGVRLFDDPARQLRYEIHHAWLLAYTEADREKYPLVEYTFGPDFIGSVETIEGIDREKVVSACVDVLTRRAWEVNGRQARQFRETAAAGSPYRVRAADNAVAWRCNLQTGTASARRLMWWEVPDGTIELSAVALHDDTDIR